MSIWHAVILGILQGATEFLPISSSGHLVLGQRLFGLNEPELVFDISVHVGTLGAVVIVYWADIRQMIVAVLRWLGRREGAGTAPQLRLAGLIVAGSVPTALIGIFFQTAADRLFSSTALVGAMLLVTGFLLWGTRHTPASQKGLERFSLWPALAIGTMQGLAILPGISRSGSTIAVALFMGIERRLAARFSFLLSIPAIIGAVLLNLFDASFHQGGVVGVTAAGTAAAFGVGYLALRWLIHLVQRKKLHFFTPYCFLLGLTALLLRF